MLLPISAVAKRRAMPLVWLRWRVRLEELELTLEFVLEAHRGQLRDGDSPLPYLTHVVDVLNNLRYVGGISDPAILHAGLLHDVLEWSDVTETELLEKFGAEVTGLVLEVTRSEPNHEQIQSMDRGGISQLRSEMLLQEVTQMSAQAKCIKLADRLSNFRAALQVRTPKRMERYRAKTRAILDVIPNETNLGLWEELDRLVH